MAVIPLQSQTNLPDQPALRSLLILECGSAWMHASLFGMAEGHCRLLARADAPTTPAAISKSMLEVLTALEQITGRHLVMQQRLVVPETETGDGIDGSAMIVSAAGPLQIRALGPGIEASASALQRISATFAAAISVSPHAPPQVQALFPSSNAAPHILLVCGDGKPATATRPPGMALEDAIRQAIAMANDVSSAFPPTIILLGNATEQSRTRATFGEQSITMLDPFADHQPSALGSVLTRAYEHFVAQSLPELPQIQAQMTKPVISAVTGLGRAVRFMAQRYVTQSLVASVGAMSTTVIGATPQGNLTTLQEAWLGLRQGAGALWRRAGYAALARWLPFTMPEAMLREAVLQRMLYPTMLPATTRELAIDHALARAALEVARRSSPSSFGNDLTHADVIIGTGGVFAHVPRLAHAALLLLDGLQPHGITMLIIDTAYVLTALGGASLLDRMAAADAVDMDALQIQLGTCIATAGTPLSGDHAVRVILEYPDGRRHTTDVLHGTIELLPLGLGQHARLMLYPAPGVDIGLGPGEQAQSDAPIEGGRLGVIIDARGRPLVLPDDTGQRIAKLRQWYAAFGL